MSTFNNTFLSDATVITFGVYLSNESRSSPDRPSAMPPAYEDPALETPPASPVTEPVFHPEDEGTGTDSSPDTEPHQQATAVEAANWLLLNQASASGLPRPATAATALRKMLLETKELIICPGVYDGLSARTAIEVGFDALYMTGAGTTASRLGQPDLAIAQLHEMRENADMIANLDPLGPPLIADMDTGYGGPIMVARTVEQYIRSGVAGAHLEDQILTKRCGHLSGKKVVPREEYLMRIRAAHTARVRLRSDFVLIARTDALQPLGYEECIARLRAARDEGADVGLLEGFTSKAQAARAVRDLAPWPLLLNSVENGKSPTITTDEAHEMGFRIMIFSFATLAPAYAAIRKTLVRLKTQGVVGTPKNITPVKLFEVCGLQQSSECPIVSCGSQLLDISPIVTNVVVLTVEIDANAGGASFKGGV
ncbi:Isocitrate lyase/phosphorylmutase [Apiospora kogelbergensis]|uniref:Isocitrate lyase/phosphorylmutase n=1 Tax=Apiospora kogelbergensis TaxID=1337665 RepID=UPI00312ECF67